LRISVRPVGRCIGGPSPARAIDASEILGAFTTTPAHSRAQGGGGSAKLFAVASFDRERCGAPLRPAVVLRAPRMRTPRGPSWALKSLHRIASISDVLVVTHRHTRVGFRIPPDVLFRIGKRPYDRSTEGKLTGEPEGLTSPCR